MYGVDLLCCPNCIDGSILEHLDDSGPVLICNVCTAEYDPETLDRID